MRIGCQLNNYMEVAIICNLANDGRIVWLWDEEGASNHL